MLLLVFFSLASLAAAETAGKPHIALIVSDDLGWDDVGFRSHQIRTPTIDKLAAEGRVLNHYYVQDVCRRRAPRSRPVVTHCTTR